MERKIQKNAQIPFCGQTRAFPMKLCSEEFNLDVKYMNLVFFTADQSAWLVLNQRGQRGF